MSNANRWRSARSHPLTAVIAVVAIGIGLWFAVSGLRADMGAGVKGTFIAQTLACGGRGNCNWHGTFDRTNGSVVATNTVYQGNVNGMVPGSVVDAIYESSTGEAYPPHSLGWIFYLVLVAFGAVGLHQWFTGSRQSGRLSNAGPSPD